LISKTKSGRNIELWFSRLLNIQGGEGVVKGPMFRAKNGKRMSIAEMDDYLHGMLLEVQRQFPRVLSDTVSVQEEFSVYRSLRRGATSEAQNAQIPKGVIEAINRWRKMCRAKGLTPGESMMEQYTDARRVPVQALTRFSDNLP
jgi:pyrroloquinoline quinone (PQQ) biosynthesis protein C